LPPEVEDIVIFNYLFLPHDAAMLARSWESPSVCPSVCLPHASFVAKSNNALQIFWYRTKGQSL